MIDWNKPLECDNGDVELAPTEEKSCTLFRVRCDDIVYYVYKETGIPGNINLGSMWQVRNKRTARDEAIAVVIHNRHYTTAEQLVDKLIEAGLIDDK